MINRETGEVFDIIFEQDGKYVIAKQACEMIESLERQMKEAKDIYAEYKDALKEAMEEHGIKSIDTPNFIATYKEQYERCGVDTKKLEHEYPEAYYDCQKITNVKSSVSVRLREKK